MDPITAALLAGIAVGAQAVGDSATKLLGGDAYHALAALLAQKYGENSEVVRAVENVQAKPASSARRAVLQEEIAARDAAQDAELVAAARALLAQIGALPNGTQIIQSVTGAADFLVQGHQNSIQGLGDGATQIAHARGVHISDGTVNAQGDIFGGDQVQGGIVVIARDSTIVVGEQPIRMTAVQRESALGRYLEHVIRHTRYLQLQGIRSGGKLVNIELEHIFITLRATRMRAVADEHAGLEDAARLLPGERAYAESSRSPEPAKVSSETVVVTVQEALADHKRLVILGAPGSGKTTLLRYLALRYARDRAENTTFVRDRLRLNESGCLPLYLPLRNLGTYLEHHPDTGVDGHALLLAFFYGYLKNERIVVPDDFLDADLHAGRVVLLLDGMDEVGSENLRGRVTRLIDSFAVAYSQCRIVVTSRQVGYSGVARLEQDFATTMVQDFNLADVREFLTHWHRLVAVGQLGPGASAEHFAAVQTSQLLNAITSNPRVRELAVNPLLLTVIALVHKDSVKLPDRRAELYAEAVNVLLGKWDEAKSVDAAPVLDDRSFDASDRRLLLQTIALQMHLAGKREIEAEELTRQLRAHFAALTPTPTAAQRAVERFLQVIRERTGLLVEAGQGVYRFSHLTFQEYLAALAALDLPDYETALVRHAGETTWREVILLAVGQLALQGSKRTTSLVQRIADAKNPQNPYAPLVLAVEGVRDAGTGMNPQVAAEIQARVKKLLAQDRPAWQKMLNQDRVKWAKDIGRISLKGWIQEKSKLIEALVQSGAGYWTMPYGEPEWITIPAGEFWMGSADKDRAAAGDEKPAHRLYVPEFKIARVPITNAQYLLYAQATGAQPPSHWIDKQPPRQLTSHPVVNVSWHDAQNYCQWLSEVTGKHIRLPGEAEWEKAARGSEDKRIYPWGDVFDSSKCNSRELGLGDTSPVGVFPSGASPYGVLDMSGNVWEWTRSLYGKWDRQGQKFESTFGYPYAMQDGRENVSASDEFPRVLRGGSFRIEASGVRCARRYGDLPYFRFRYIGFRVGVAPV